MPFVMRAMWVPDAIDDELRSSGWLSETEVAREMGMSTNWVRTQISCRNLMVQDVSGRPVIDVKEVEALMRSRGHMSDDARRLEELEALPNRAGECGYLGQQRNLILERMQARREAEMRGQGVEPTPRQYEVERTVESAADDYLNLFSRRAN